MKTKKNEKSSQKFQNKTPTNHRDMNQAQISDQQNPNRRPKIVTAQKLTSAEIVIEEQGRSEVKKW